MSKEITEIAPGVGHLEAGISNVYFVGKPGSKWVLVDTGTPGKARLILRAAADRYGAKSRPECILLTHGHFDHSGSALDLANSWDVPVYAHRLEAPYLTGKSAYPPPDPTTPGFMALISRFFTGEGVDLSGRLRLLEPGAVPGLPGWEWRHTPGHTPGHVSYFRPEDATLLTGDAFLTVNVNSLFAIVSKKQHVSGPPAPSTLDWDLAADSIRKLDHLNPLTLACGHGIPMYGFEASEELAALAYRFRKPPHGRYVAIPARADENGVTYVPPAPPDRTPAVAGAVGIAALSGVMFAIAAQRRRHRLAG